MSRIQQLRNVAGEADTLSQVLDEFFREHTKESVKDFTASDLRRQVLALGQNARAALVEAISGMPAPLYIKGSILLHIASGRHYLIRDVPSVNGPMIEATAEPAYAYVAVSGRGRLVDVQGVIWVRCQEEIEDPERFQLVSAKSDLFGIQSLREADSPPPYPIETESRAQEGNGWVANGFMHTAMFVHPQPAGIKGCPLGRSQKSLRAAVTDLLVRVNDENRLSLDRADLVHVRHQGIQHFGVMADLGIPTNLAEP